MDRVEEMAGATTKAPTELANRWLTTKECKQYSVPVRDGPFSETEAQQIQEAIVQYREAQKLSQDEVDEIIFGALSGDGFWNHLARAVPQRRIRSVYDHVRRANHPSRNRGKWKELEDRRLKQFIQQGLSWSEIGDAMNRPSADCRYRFEVYLHVADRQCQGMSQCAWTLDEEARLDQIMQDLGEPGKTAGKTKFWVEVSERMDKTRSSKQCFNKCSHPRWRACDSKLLVQKVARLDLDREDDIRWDELIDARWEQWTSDKLQQRWCALKKTVYSPGATHRDVVQLLTSRPTTSRAHKIS